MCKFIFNLQGIHIYKLKKQSHPSFYSKFQFETEAQIYDQCKKCAVQGRICLKTIYKLLGLKYAHFECLDKQKEDTDERADYYIREVDSNTSVQPSDSNDETKVNKPTGECKL